MKKGPGLGLAIVQTIIDNHSGEIEVVSREGQGATMIIQAPAYTTRIRCGRGSCANRMDTILIVDDERNYLLVLEALLSEEGYQVITAEGAQSGLECIGKTIWTW